MKVPRKVCRHRLEGAGLRVGKDIRKQFIVCAISLAPVMNATCFAQSSSTQPSIPAAGDDVKKGDIVIWNVNKPISVTDSNGNAKTTAALQTAAPTPATDAVAVATAIQSAAKSAVATAGGAVGVANPTPSAMAALRAANAAAKTADSNALAAGAAAITKPPIGASTVDLAEATVQSATKIATDAMSDANEALTQQVAAQSAADKAKADPKLSAAATLAAASAEAKVDAAAAAKAYLAAARSAQKSIADAYSIVQAAANAVPASAEQVCFPKGSRFDITSVAAATSTNTNSASSKTSSGSSSNSSQKSASSKGGSATPSDTQLVAGHFPSSSGNWLHWFHENTGQGFMLANDEEPATTPCGAAAPKTAVLDTTYYLNADQLAQSDYKREGFTWGGLVIPFKFYLSDKSIKTNSSVVGFAGYEGWFPGVSLSTVVAAGAGTAPVTTSTPTTGNSSAAAGSSNSTTTAVTYSVAVGAIATFGGVVKAGVLIGRDYQGNPANFAYENKTWLALSIGAGF
jgi:hypothetical protein